DVFIATLGERPKTFGLKLAKDLRAKGYSVLTDVMGRGLKAQLKYADRSDARYTVVIGDDELEKGVVTLRDMDNSTQKEIAIDKIEEEIHR
ncbi:MAG: histidine--tRNA ligase, partial [Firmicutes bacterium]|nr:histidine--tRNA ligase [Bacillota bacterium]